MNKREIIQREIAGIFNQAQITAASHERCIQSLRKVYDKCEIDEFFEVFATFLSAALQQDYKVVNPFVERVIQFIAAFSTSIKPTLQNDESYVEPEFLEDVFHYLLEAQANADHIVRFRSCQLINKLLNQLIGEDVTLDLCDYIQECMLERIKDAKVSVRLQAVTALHRLQDPSNPKDPIIEQYVLHMQGDNSWKVRKVCVENIVVRREIAAHLIKRMRDVHHLVRYAAFKRAQSLPNHFKIIEKQAIIKNGFRDSSSLITKFMTNQLVPAWLEFYNTDYLKLLNTVRLDADEKDISESVTVMDYILKALFATRPHIELIEVLKFNENRVLPLGQLNWETIIYWYHLVNYLRSNPDYEDVLDEVLPELVNFCKYAEEYYKLKTNELEVTDHLEYQFILKYMFLIMKGYDFSDVATRQYFNGFVVRILKEAILDTNTVKTLVDCLEKSIPNVEKRKTFICEIISDIIHPVGETVIDEAQRELDLQIAQLKVKLNCLKEDQVKVVENRDFAKALEYQNEMAEAQSKLDVLQETIKVMSIIEPPQQDITKLETSLLVKCLNIAEAILSTREVLKLCPVLRSLKKTFVEELLCHKDEQLRCKALKCYALCCIIDRQTAETGIHVLSASILAYSANIPCDINTLLVAIDGVSDMLVMFGSSLITSPDDDGESDSMHEQDLCIFKGGTSLTSLVQGLVDLMDDDKSEVQEHAVKGLCNLIYSGRVHSSALISRMILKWCHPISDDDEESQKVQQLIGLMLQDLPAIPDTAGLLEQAILPTIRVLVRAPKNSPLFKLNIEHIAKFMLQLCQQYNSEFCSIHYNLAVTIGNEIQSKPTSKFNLEYTKILLLLSLPNDAQMISELINLYTDARDFIKDRDVSKNLVKFIALLHTFRDNLLTTIKEESKLEE